MVIVVIALLGSGILVAQTLIRTAQLNRILSEYDSYVKAFSEFHEKYLAYPGDMNNAESYWGSDAACPNTPSNTAPKIATCNGNGDGKVGDSDTSGNLSNSREWFRAWQQMGNANFLADKFTGAPGNGGVAEAAPPFNVPETGENGAGWTLHYLQLQVNGALWADQYSHVIDLGQFAVGNRTITPFLTGSEALALDAKVDDGKPGRGYVRAWRTSVLASCTNNDVSQDAQAYVTTGTARTCSMVFLMPY